MNERAGYPSGSSRLSEASQPSRLPAQGRRDADPDRPLRPDAESADRAGATTGHKFMPGKFVFPGGRVEPADHRMPVAGALDPARTEASLLTGSAQDQRRSAPARWRSPRSARPSRRPACARPRRTAAPDAGLAGPWAPFAAAWRAARSLRPAFLSPAPSPRPAGPSGSTPASSRSTPRPSPTGVEGVVRPDSELVELVWVEIGSRPLRRPPPDHRNGDRTNLGQTAARPGRSVTTCRCRSSISTAAEMQHGRCSAATLTAPFDRAAQP